MVLRIGKVESNFTKEFLDKRIFDVDYQNTYQYEQRPNQTQETNVKKKKTHLLNNEAKRNKKGQTGKNKKMETSKQTKIKNC